MPLPLVYLINSPENTSSWRPHCGRVAPKRIKLSSTYTVEVTREELDELCELGLVLCYHGSSTAADWALYSYYIYSGSPSIWGVWGDGEDVVLAALAHVRSKGN
jgi:hypothetical protein